MAMREIVMRKDGKRKREYLFVSDFDQTLTRDDSGVLLAEMLGIADFDGRVAELSERHLVQHGGELGYLLLHDPDFRRVRRDDLREIGKRIRLKTNIGLLLRLLQNLDESHFRFHVLSSVPEEIMQSALAGLVPEANIHGTRFRYSAETGEIQSVACVPAGHSKVTALEELRSAAAVRHDRIVYVGNGHSDVQMMLHVNRLEGLTICVSENNRLSATAKRTVISDDALSILIPILEEIVGYDPAQVRSLFGSQGFILQEWGKAQTDSLTFAAGV
jgi:phosphoserine phosphatase